MQGYRNLARSAATQFSTDNLSPYDEYSKLAALNDGVMTYCNSVYSAATAADPYTYPCVNNFQTDDYRWINNYNKVTYGLSCADTRGTGTFYYDEETEEELEIYELYYYTCYSTYYTNESLTIDLGEEFDVQSVIMMYSWKENLGLTEALD